MYVDPKSWGIALVVIAVISGVFGIWAYSSQGAGNFGITLKTNKNLTNGEVLHLTFDGKDTNWSTGSIVDASGNSHSGTWGNHGGGSGGNVVTYLTTTGSNQTYVIPSDWSNTNTIEVIGGGAGGGNGWCGVASGAGAYSAITNFSSSAGTNITYRVGSGGTGGAANTSCNNGTSGTDSWFNGASSSTASVAATAGLVAGAAAGKGGFASDGTGTTKFSGGGGGAGCAGNSGAGGGGAAGPNGDGKVGGSCGQNATDNGGAGGGGANNGSVGVTANANGENGVAGGNGRSAAGGGTGGTVGTKPGGNGTVGGGGGGGYDDNTGSGGVGGTDAVWDSTHGPGGGGGGGGGNGTTLSGAGGNGGLYGGGGGTGGYNGGTAAAGGNGAQGIIVVTYLSNATSSGPPVQVRGRIGEAASFDGATSTVRVGDLSATIKTVSFWMQAATSTASSSPINIAAGVQVKVINGVVTATGWTSPTIYVDGVVSSTLADTNWHHVVVTSATGISATNVLIGQAGGTYFGGSMDDVRMYSRVLSSFDVTRLYHLGATTRINNTLKTNKALNGNAAGELVHYTFDGKDMINNVADVSGNGNNGTLSSWGATSTVLGRIGQGLNWSGANAAGEYVSIPTSGLPTTKMSVSVWFKTAQHESWNNFISSNNWAVTSGSWIVYDDASGAVTYGLYNGAQINANGSNCAAINTVNRWHHVVGTYDGATSLLYEDGILCNTPGSIAVALNVAAPGQLGSAATNNVSSLTLDDVRIYNRVLSAAEVLRLYHLGATSVINKTVNSNTTLTGTKGGEVGHWTFDGQTILSNIADVSGNNNTAHFVNVTSTSTQITIGKIGQAFVNNPLGGQTAYVDVNSQTLTNFDWNSPFTISTWIKRTGNNTTANPIVTDALNNSAYTGYALYMEASTVNLGGNSNGIDFYLNNTNSTFMVEVATPANSLPADGQWHHVVAITNGAGTAAGVSIYIDNVLQSLNTIMDTLGGRTLLNNQDTLIGSDKNNWYLQAAVDDVRIYSRALSAFEVKRLYNLGK